MTVTATEPTARYRKSRTRTRKVSAREALAVSTLRPHHYDLRPACASLVCPDCRTWVPITGIHATVQKLVPHHTDPVRTRQPRRCSGSNRRVDVDVAYAVWERRLEDGVAQVSDRRPTKVLPKPKPQTAPAVTQIRPQPVSAADALAAYREHLTVCRRSPVADRCLGTRRCTDGIRLAALYQQLARTQQRRDDARQELDDVQHRLENRFKAAARRNTAAEWEQRAQTTADARATVKRSGTTIEDANNLCRPFPDPVEEHRRRGPSLPLKQQQPSAP